jgi:surface antigen Omp85-like protein
MRASSIVGIFSVVLLVGAVAASAQQADPETRQDLIERGQADKVETLHPYVLTRGERIIASVQERLVNQQITWHPFFQNAYSGGGLALGLGYMRHVSPYSTIDVRGSYSIRSYKLAEVEFVSPRLFRRRAGLSLLGAWRDAPEVGFYAVGSDPSSSAHLSYGFEESRGSGLLTVWPTRRLLMLRGGAELSRWDLKSGSGRLPSIDTLFTPATLSGLGQTTTYVHTQATVGLDSRKAFDWMTSPGYARRGGFYGVTAHDFADQDSRFGFRQVDYEAVQHVPILRETWVVSLRGRAETAWGKNDQQVPFYLLPSLGGSSSLRGFPSWRFRGRNSLLLQGEWRILVNRGFETALFYDAGKVAERVSDLDLDGLHSDYGFGARFHALHATFLRAEVAHSPEGYRFVFATSAAF